jgi:hypothetical protein
LHEIADREMIAHSTLVEQIDQERDNINLHPPFVSLYSIISGPQAGLSRSAISGNSGQKA